MDQVRSKSSPRRTVPLRLVIFLSVVVAVGAGALVAAGLALNRALDDATAHQIEALQAALRPLEEARNARLRPIIEESARLRDWLLSGTADPRAPMTARALLAPLLQSNPDVQAITLLRAGEVAYALDQEGMGWQAPLDTVHPARITDPAFARYWDADGEETPSLAERIAPGLDNPQDLALFEEALRACALAPNDNREGLPRLAWSYRPAAPDAAASLACAVAVRDRSQAVHLASFRLRPELLLADIETLPEGATVVLGGLGATWCVGAGAAQPAPWIDLAKARAVASPAPMGATRHAMPAQLDPQRGVHLGAWSILPGGPEFWMVLFRSAEPDILPAMRTAAAEFGPAFLLTLVLLLLLLYPIPRALSRLMRVATAKVETVGVQGRPPRYWPSTRIREVRNVQRMLDYLLRASAREPMPSTAGEAPDLETLDMAVVEAELLAPEDQAIIETGAQTLTPPPDAYVQALQTTRRQLRELQAEVEGLYLELQDAGTRDQDLQQRLLRQRAALSEIAAGRALYGDTTLDALTALATAACAALSLARVGVWMFEDGRRRLRGALRYERLNRRGDAAPDLFRSQLPVFFLTLESEAVITARDAASDARLRDWLEVLNETPPSSSVVAIVLRRGEEAVALCTFECTGPCRQWEPDEVNFLAGIAHLIAPRIAAPLLLAATEAAPAALPEVAPVPAVEEGVPFRALVEHAAGMLWTMDPEGRFVYVNPTAAEAYGWDPGQMTGRFVTEFTATGFAQLERLALRAVRDGQPKYSYLTEHLCADGKTMTLAVNLAPLRNEAGVVTGCVAVAADTSHAHKRVEEGAPDEQTHFRRLVEGSHELIFELDAIGCIVAVNPAVARVFGYTPEELRGEPIAKLADADQNRGDLDRLSAVLDGAECTAYETRHRRKDGQPVRLLVVAEPQRDAEGRISGIIGAAIELIEVDAGAVW